MKSRPQVLNPAKSPIVATSRWRWARAESSMTWPAAGEPDTLIRGYSAASPLLQRSRPRAGFVYTGTAVPHPADQADHARASCDACSRLDAIGTAMGAGKGSIQPGYLRLSSPASRIARTVLSKAAGVNGFSIKRVEACPAHSRST